MKVARLMTPYASWTREQLIARLQVLDVATQTRPSVNTEDQDVRHIERKHKKEEKIFDFHRYQQRYVAFKIAYLGWSYNGLALQALPTPLPTVEKVLFDALLKTRLIDSIEGCRFSRCGRTDKGVSAMGQVIALNVRSSQLKAQSLSISRDSEEVQMRESDEDGRGDKEKSMERKELDWIASLNQCLPSDIRVLAYDDTIAPDFDARFSCRGRHYKYLFAPRVPGSEYLDIEAMNEACRNLVGVHDFRNFCKLDASKQITNFERNITHCTITKLERTKAMDGEMGLYCLDLKGSAFLWHQVRCITAVLLLVGQHHEKPDIITRLFNMDEFHTKPVYEMADDWPLTLWDCDFGDLVNWKYPANAQKTVESTFAMLHESRIKGTITGFLCESAMACEPEERRKNGILLGDGRVRVQKDVVPLDRRRRMEAVEVINAAWLEKKASKSTIMEDSFLAE